MAPVSSLRNIGPKTEAALLAVGVGSAEALRRLGADAVYARLLAAGTRPHFIAYAVLVLALQGRDYDEMGEDKAALRARFDALKAAQGPAADAAMRRALDALGVRGA